MNKKISQTAAFIAIKFYGLSLNEKLGQHFPSWTRQFYSDVVEFLPGSLSWYHKALAKPGWRKLFVRSEELLLPGDLMHIIGRKFYIQKLVAESLERDIEQVIILGAGFDHLGAWCASRGIPSFEIDTPVMTQHKVHLLEKYDYDQENLFCCPLDVNRDSLDSVLMNHPSFKAGKNTLIIAEGFFDYLNLNTTVDLLHMLADLCPAHSLITTLFSLDELNIFHRFSFTSGVAMVGESIRLPLSRDGFLRLLQEHNYNRDQLISYKEIEQQLIQRSGIELPVMKGFYIIQASRI